ncbi:T9SS type A sorting domain-containing protein [Dyadobacter pollutisoli]|uniref:T9SS type A sorting domain-containing protein n=1 Tax=Dyadobacter pollutisoli TaxID=2910158 RepID=A0A9E8SRM1_9BACT|nr:T9SS type A sorting domain-containing protein [Dyadobacter pollutisoli]WAC14342.1 T9SS type A sorting domain-containing protein [Dyadobacter pollutisoli]
MKRALLCMLLAIICHHLKATTFDVTSLSDANTPGTLRNAIVLANADLSGPHDINFKIAGTIVLTADLPAITNHNISINGYSAPGASVGTIQSRVITMAIDLAGFNGFTFQNTYYVYLSGLSIYNTGINNTNAAIRAVQDISILHVWGCYIGAKENGSVTGTTNMGTGVHLQSSYNGGISSVFIGTNGDGAQDSFEGNLVNNTAYDPAQYRTDRNSGIYAKLITGLTIAGNYIGPTDKFGNTAILESTNKNGGIMLNDCREVIVGTNGDGISDALEGNIISGNGRDGLRLLDTSNMKIAGNVVGLGADGTTELGNGNINTLALTTGKIGTNGITFSRQSNDASLDIVIGTNADGVSDNLEGNIISAHKVNLTDDSADGIEMADVNGVSIAGNKIGTDVTGMLAKGNAGNGINLFLGGGRTNSGAYSVTIGYDDAKAASLLPAMRNVISSNGMNGILYTEVKYANGKICGNFIGLNNLGVASMGNGNGIRIEGTSEIVIGTDGDEINDQSERNYICNSTVAGIIMYSTRDPFNPDEPGQVERISVSGNNIGVDFAAAAAGNGYGIMVIDGSKDIIIGSRESNPLASMGNLIANSTNYGIGVGNITKDFIAGIRPVTSCLISRNSFHNNGGLSINLLDLNAAVDVNDGALGSGTTNSNNALDYPIFTKFVLHNDGTITVSGYVGTAGATEETPGTTINEVLNIEVYKQDNDGNQDGAVSTGHGRITPHGEGGEYLGTIATDATGKFTNVTFTPVAGSTIQTGDAITGTASRTGTVKSTSEFGIMSGDIVLPVELIHFNATLQENTVSLFWSTSEEINSDYFEIQRSADAKNWQALSRVEARENSNTVQEYRYDDRSPLFGISYYRLKQVDIDGSFAYSFSRNVNSQHLQTSFVYPNPVKSLLTIEGLKTEAVQLFNANGRELQVRKLNRLSKDQFSLDMSDLKSGIYFIKDGDAIYKVIKE